MIPKNGHAAIQYVSCLLNYKETGDEAIYKRFTSLDTFSGAFDKGCVHIVNERKPGSDNFERIFFLRDPLKRFISGWLFTCKRYRFPVLSLNRYKGATWHSRKNRIEIIAQCTRENEFLLRMTVLIRVY